VEEIRAVKAHSGAFRPDHKSDSTPCAHDFGPFQAGSVQSRTGGALFPLPSDLPSAESCGRPGFPGPQSGVQACVEENFGTGWSGGVGIVAVVEQATEVDDGTGPLARGLRQDMGGGGGADESDGLFRQQKSAPGPVEAGTEVTCHDSTGIEFR